MSNTLVSGAVLTANQALSGPVVGGQQVQALFQVDGNFVVYWGPNFRGLWAVAQQASAAVKASMDPDGNFVLYDAQQHVVWSTQTSGHPGSALVLEADGMLNVVTPTGNVVWTSGVGIATIQPRPAAQLRAGEQLNVGQCLKAPRQPYTCTLQTDGNLVVSKLTNTPLWASATSGRPAGYAAMQTDGNFVIYDADSTPVWSSKTDGHPGSFVVMQDDGNLVIYGPDQKALWASHTVQPTPATEWAILLCKFSDVATEPQPLTFYQDFFTNPAAGGAASYFLDVTNGKVELSTARVIPWLTLAHKLAEAPTSHERRGDVLTWAKDAAAAAKIDLSPYKHLLVLVNAHCDSGNVAEARQHVTICTDANDVMHPAFVCHEMGHGLGLNHSHSANPDTEYGSECDLMSEWSSTNFPAVIGGVWGQCPPGTNAHYLYKLGYNAPTAVVKQRSDFSVTLGLNALTQPPAVGVGGYSSIQVTAADGTVYVVEARRKRGWDRAIPVDQLILINQVRSNDDTYLVPTKDSYFTSGEHYTITNSTITIGVGTWRDDQVLLWVWDMPDGCLRQDPSTGTIFQIIGGKATQVSGTQLAALRQTHTIKPIMPGFFATP